MKPPMLDFKTIAVATDLGETSSNALRRAQEIAHQHNSALIIVHIIDPVGYAFPKGAPAALAADHTARDEVKRIEEEVRGRGIEVHSVIQSGTICDCILQAVSDHRVDLLVLGTRARTKAGAVALGTVARQLLAKAPCSILTVPSNEDEASRSTRGWQRVLAATDFSAASLSALRLAQSIVKGRLVVLHAASCGNEQKCSHCLERLRLLAPSHEPHRIPVEHIVISGEAGEMIARCARKLHVDLVVLGSPEKERTAGDFRSSTVLRVISSVSCPVLCVPSTKQSAPHDLIHEVSFAC